MLVPEGVTSERQRARYVVRVYRAEVASSAIKRNKLLCRSLDHVDPQVRIFFAGLEVSRLRRPILDFIT
jgi:hypothetical protein